MWKTLSKHGLKNKNEYPNTAAINFNVKEDSQLRSIEHLSLLN